MNTPLYVHKSIATIISLISVACYCQAGIVLDFNDEQQRVVMMGTDMVRSSGSLQKASNTSSIINWVFKDTTNVGYLRVAIDKKQELVEGDRDLGLYDAQIQSMQQIKSVHSTVKFWATLKTDYAGYQNENNLPDWIYTGSGYNGGSYDPTKLNVTKYATFLVDYLEHMNDNGVRISTISVGKEWTAVMDARREKQTIDKVKTFCAARGVPAPKFVGPATFSVTSGTSFLNAVENGDGGNWKSRYNGFCTHDYTEASVSQWRNFVNKATDLGKPAYDEESSTGGHARTSGVELDIGVPIENFSQKAKSYEAGLDGELFYEMWSRLVDAETRSIYFKNNRGASRKRSYYLFKEFASNTKWSYYVPTSGTSNLNALETMAFRRGNDVTVWVMNHSNSSYSNVEFQSSGRNLDRAERVQRRKWTNSSSKSGNLSTFEESNNTKFYRTIPAKSICLFYYTVL